MALKYFLPNKKYSWIELNKMTIKEPGRGTWCFPALAALKSEGLNILYIENFDYMRYYQEGQGYLISFYGRKIAECF